MNDTPTPTAETPEENLAIAVEHREFCENLPRGKYRVIINPKKAARYVKHRLFLIGFTVPLIGTGIALVLWGFTVAGFMVGAFGFVLPRIVAQQAGRILLHLAQHDAKTYYDAVNYEIMEVRLSRD